VLGRQFEEGPMSWRRLQPLVVSVLMLASIAGAGDYDPLRDPQHDLRAAVKEAQVGGKRILLVVGGEWCSWCKILDGFIKATPDVAELWTKHFITVHVNFSEENQNATFLGQFPVIEGYPHIFVLDKDGRLLHSQETSLLERGNSYSRDRLKAFLQAWTPK
jgi:thioredoxin-related protein